MPKSKREEIAATKEEGDYKFELPAFDEKAFIRREVNSAKAGFYALGLATVAGVVATGMQVAGLDWKLGWLPIALSMAALGPVLKARGFGEDMTTPKALAGNSFMILFTALSVWILGVNVV